MAGVLAADWPAPTNVIGLTTQRDGPGVSERPFDRFNLGIRCGDDVACATENRHRLRRALELPSAPNWLQQVHGVAVARFDAAVTQDDRTEPVADASVTSTPGCVLAVLTADCLPVLFCAADGSEVGAAHAGWRGLAAGVLESTVSAMRTPPARLLAWLGPAAGPTAYEVGDEVREAFLASDVAAASAFASTRAGHWRVDLYALARQRLARVGLDRVFGGGLCTISDPQRFYSHRRDQSTGRMASLIWMRP
ncbi:peptidoglycan editing factor PgeF [Arenimonas sp.]|uniref:peptidoglycan editing factor PgeF n=1 Tax=Arenimonas sp. TaxID=1872635 RepID=UPI0039E6EC7D